MFNQENFTPDNFFYTGTTCGACDKYEVCTGNADFGKMQVITNLVNSMRTLYGSLHVPNAGDNNE